MYQTSLRNQQISLNQQGLKIYNKIKSAILNHHFDLLYNIFTIASIFFWIQRTQIRLKIYAGPNMNYLPLEVIISENQTRLQENNDISRPNWINTILDISNKCLDSLFIEPAKPKIRLTKTCVY